LYALLSFSKMNVPSPLQGAALLLFRQRMSN
jgi:hypothetical protein